MSMNSVPTTATLQSPDSTLGHDTRPNGVNGPQNYNGEQRSATQDRRTFTLKTMYCCAVMPRRSSGRRSEDRRFANHDVFSTGSLLLIVLLTLFSITDAVFTLTLIARGGTELNPVMHYFMQISVSAFMLVKLVLTIIPGLFLTAAGNTLFLNRIRAKAILAAMVGGYAGLLLYEIGLLIVSA